MSAVEAKKAREAMKAKAARLAGSSNSMKPFYSEEESKGSKVGMRPISRRAYKDGGKVSGAMAAPRADRVARKSGGRIANEIANMDVKAANAERPGKSPVGGMKKGGVIKKAGGGPTGRLREQVGRNMVDEMKNMSGLMSDSAVNRGGVTGMLHGSARKSGGKIAKKAKTQPAKTARAERPMERPMVKPEKKAAPMARTAIPAAEPKGVKGPKFEFEKDAPKPKDMTTAIDLSKEDDDLPEEKEAMDRTNMMAGMKRGGRAKRWSGGPVGEKKRESSSKGKTNINIVIASPAGANGAGAGQSAGPMPPMAPPPRDLPPMPPKMGGMPPGMPPMPPGAGGPAGVPPGMPPMMPPMGALAAMGKPPGGGHSPLMDEMKPPMRKAGGSVNLRAGAGSGLGRLQKARMK